jgi:O-antigen ligase
LIINFIHAGSRGGFLGLIAIGTCTVLGFRPIKARKRLSAFIFALGALTVVGGDAFWAKMKTIFAPEDDYNVSSETGRLQIWRNGLSLIRQRPFLGVGAREFSEAEGTLSDLARERIEVGAGLIPWQRAHNSYLSVAAETGLGGFAVFVTLLLTSLFVALSLVRRANRLPGGRDLAALARALAISLIGYIVSAFFLTSEYQAVLYLDLGLLVGVRKLVTLRRRQPEAAPRPQWQPTPRPPVRHGFAPEILQSQPLSAPPRDG